MKAIPRALIALAVTGTAMVTTAGPYLGGSIGKADYNEDLWSEEDDLNDTGWKIFGGYQFNRYLGVETAWIDLGKVNHRDSSIETTGLVLEGTASLPIS